MPVRPGCAELIVQFLAMVDDAYAETFSHERSQTILDAHRSDFYQQPLVPTPQQVGGSVVYKVYTCAHGELEGSASGADAFRLYDSIGNTISANAYTADLRRGVFTFSADQAGKALYLDGRSFDLNGAAADGWRERAAKQAGNFDFGVDGAQFRRSQWFTHCMQMATHYARQGRAVQATVERGDMC